MRDRNFTENRIRAWAGREPFTVYLLFKKKMLGSLTGQNELVWAKDRNYIKVS